MQGFLTFITPGQFGVTYKLPIKMFLNVQNKNIPNITKETYYSSIIKY